MGQMATSFHAKIANIIYVKPAMAFARPCNINPHGCESEAWVVM